MFYIEDLTVDIYSNIILLIHSYVTLTLGIWVIVKIQVVAQVLVCWPVLCKSVYNRQTSLNRYCLICNARGTNVVGLIVFIYMLKQIKQAQTYSQMDMWYRLVYIKKICAHISSLFSP